MKKDKVSIITTFYNAERFIGHTLWSINQQKIDGFDFEYVLVDDKSPDNSRKIVEDFIATQVPDKYKKCWRIVTPDENLGCGGARKFGIDNARGDYFMFVDADDYYINGNFVYRAYNTIKAENADIVEYGVLFNQPNGQQINNTANQRYVIENNPALAEISLFKDNLIKFNVWSKIYRREIVESYPYSTSRTYEDVRTIPIWVKNAKKIIIEPTPEINYRAAEGSIIRSDMIKTRVGTITAIAELFPKFADNFAVLKAMYVRSMVDLEALLHNHSSNDAGFNEMNALNTFMLKYIYPNDWQKRTYNIENDQPAEVSTASTVEPEDTAPEPPKEIDFTEGQKLTEEKVNDIKTLDIE